MERGRDDPLHYGNIFEYLSLWSEVQFLKIQKSKKKARQDKVNTADSAFMFLIILSLSVKINGYVGQGGEDGLVWSGLC